MYGHLVNSHFNMILVGKIKENGALWSKLIEEKDFEEYKNNGFYIVEEIDDSKLNNTKEYNTIRLSVELIDDIIKYKYTEVPDKALIKADIEKYKELLNNSDYKVIKAYELSLTKQDNTIDVELLHLERQEYRDKINELQLMLNESNETEINKNS